MISRHEVRDHKGRTLMIERDIIEIRERSPDEHVIDGDAMDGPVVGHFLRWERAMIDGEPANKRRVGQFIRRAREAKCA